MMNFIPLTIIYVSVLGTSIEVMASSSVVISAPVIVEVGDTLQLPCTTSELYFDDVKTFWYKESGPQPENFSESNGILTITDIKSADSGIYSCQVADSNTKQQIAIMVKDPNRFSYVLCPKSQPIQEIIIQPGNFVGRSGDVLVLACFNAANKSSSVNWSKMGLSELPSHVIIRDGILIIQNISVDDSGRYICTSSTAASANDTSSISNAADVLITSNENRLDPPRVEFLDRLYRIVPGLDFTLPCEASGSSDLVVTWKKTDSHKLGSNVQQIGNHLKINIAQPDNRGVYECIAESNGHSVKTSTTLDMELHAPQIEIHPNHPQVVKKGDSVTFTCKVTAGTPTPSVKWTRRNNSPFSNRVKIISPEIISISNITAVEVGDYECKASNEVGDMIKNISLTTQRQFVQLLPPLITISPNVKELILDEGDQLHLICSADGSPPPRAVWKRLDGVPVLNMPLSKNLVSIHRFRINQSDEAIYVCTATNEIGVIDEQIKVTIRPKPVQQYILAVGDGARLTCQLKNANKSLSWRRKDGQALPRTANLTGGELYIEHAQKEDAGIYECMLHDANSYYPVVTTELIVVEPPSITFNPPEPGAYYLGNEGNIYCNVTGDKPIQIEWFYEDHQTLPQNVQVNGNYLKFNQITPENAGRYYCTASNVHGKATKTADIILKDRNINETKCKDSEFQCNNGTCISRDHVCDDVADCSFSEDEFCSTDATIHPSDESRNEPDTTDITEENKSSRFSNDSEANSESNLIATGDPETLQ